jgi:hypothetical protein
VRVVCDRASIRACDCIEHGSATPRGHPRLRHVVQVPRLTRGGWVAHSAGTAPGVDRSTIGAVLAIVGLCAPRPRVQVCSRFVRSLQAVCASLPASRSHSPGPVPFGRLRALCALALQAGIHPKVVQERLGHANVSITLDTYSNVDLDMQAAAAARVAALVNGATP